MELNDRQRAILLKLNETGRVRVSALSRELFFSEMTIRRDLEKMEKEGLLKRTHGGAIENLSDFEYPVNLRSEINKEQKKRLAQQATRFLSDGQLIFFNSSSTLAYILPYLSDYKNVRVVTNSVYLLSIIAQMHIPCSLTGGRYNEIEQSLSGRQAEEFLKELNPDVAFLSCEALSDGGRVTDSDEDLAEIAKIAIRKSKTSVMLMDRSKVGVTCSYDVCTTDQLDGVIIF
ncbi:MAG: DeoR/GlpR transcriptional regulator [Clostridia bacterium]|nr:DeoR/GlpR transcriptional regulator [Clostridia bacterium]MBP5429122.1 DeoR/GlpR transcriptional regulator [Clostridia bacterium]